MAKASHSGSEHALKLPHIHGGTVGQGPIGLSPDVLRRVQVRRVGRELFHVEPGMGGDPLVDSFSAMNGSPIPQQDNGTTQMLEQMSQERSDIQPGEIAAAQPEIERHPPALERHGQGTDGRKPIVLVAGAHDRRAACRSPGACHVRDEQKARFIQKDEVGTTSRSVVLYGASASASTAQSPPRPVAGLGVRASDNSIPTGSGASRHDRDGSALRTAGGSAAPHASRSINRFDSLLPRAPSGAAPPAASSAPRRDRRDDLALVVAAIHAFPVFGRPRPHEIRNSRRHPRPGRLPTALCPP